MKSFAFLPLLSIASAYQLFIESSNAAVSGKGISSIHEGAGFNYFFAGDGAEDLTYDASTKHFTQDVGGISFSVSVTDNILTNGVIGSPATIDLSSGYVSINGSDAFTACKNINDPYSYSTSEYAITKYADGSAPAGCIPIKLKVQNGASSSSVAPSATPYYGNTTTTQGITVTDYTTYCPEHTTVTITTCSNHKCAPTAITVTSATTLTVTGECLIASSAPPAPTTKATTHSTVAAQSSAASTHASVSTFNNGAGANKVAGLGGLAIMCALLV